eukprot:8553472-Pyramimonas_sp.AAC.1
MSQWHRPHASATTKHNLRLRHTVQRFVGAYGAPPKVPMHRPHASATNQHSPFSLRFNHP